MLVQPDPNVAAVCIKVYNNASFVGAAVYAPFNGGMLVEFRPGTGEVVGAIDVEGLGNCRTPVESRYQAAFAGRLR